MDFAHTYVLIPKEEENTSGPGAEHEKGDSEQNISAGTERFISWPACPGKGCACQLLRAIKARTGASS